MTITNMDLIQNRNPNDSGELSGCETVATSFDDYVGKSLQGKQREYHIKPSCWNDGDLIVFLQSATRVSLARVSSSKNASYLGSCTWPGKEGFRDSGGPITSWMNWTWRASRLSFLGFLRIPMPTVSRSAPNQQSTILILLRSFHHYVLTAGLILLELHGLESVCAHSSMGGSGRTPKQLRGSSICIAPYHPELSQKASNMALNSMRSD